MISIQQKLSPVLTNFSEYFSLYY